jgi:pectate lyase
MYRYTLLLLLPAVLGCTNPDSDPCASYITAHLATASAFCATFTKSTVTATTSLPSWASNCSNKPSAISKECTCAFTAGGSTPTTTTTTTKSGTTGTTLTTVTTATPTVGNSCGSAAVNGLVGYAAGTTGGGSGSGTTVTSCSALTAAIANAGVIKISGILSGCGVLDLKSSTTVLGVGSDSGKLTSTTSCFARSSTNAGKGLTNGGFRLKSVTNVILRNLKMHDPPEGEDLISLNLATKVWVDHCDLSTEGAVGDKDYYDGLLDITHASDYVTVSWTKFHDHVRVHSLLLNFLRDIWVCYTKYLLIHSTVERLSHRTF